MRSFPWAVACAAVASVSARGAWADTGPGLPAELEQAVVVRVPPAGFDALAEAVAAMLPPQIALDGVGGEATCVEGDPPLTFSVDGVTLDVAVDEVAIVPGDGRLDARVALTVSGSGGAMTYGGTCLLPLGEDSCPFDLAATPVVVDLGLEVGFDPETGAVVVPASGATLSLDLLPVPNPLDPDACLLGYLLEAEELFDVPLQEILLGPFLDEALAGLPAEVATALEEAFAGLQVDTVLDVGAAQPIALRLAPTGLALTADEGLELTLGGSAAVEHPASCLSAAPTDIAATPGAPPPFAGTDPAGNGYAAQVLLSDDLASQLVLAAYRSGLLCYTVEDLVNAGLLGLLFPPLLDFADSTNAPARIVVVPGAPPTAAFTGEPDVSLALDALGVDAYTASADRLSRAFGLSLDAVAGLDVDLTGGAITPQLSIDTGSIAAQVRYLEPFPGAEEALLAAVPTLLDTAVSALLGGDLIGSFTVPGLYGVTVADLRLGAEGDGQWLSAWASLDASGAEPLEIDLAAACAGGGCESGCSEGSGCGEGSGCDEGCEGGCHQARGLDPTRAAARAGAALLAAGLLVRRRSR